MDEGKRAAIAFSRNPLFFPALLFLERRELCVFGKYSGCCDSLPFEDFECQPGRLFLFSLLSTEEV